MEICQVCSNEVERICVVSVLIPGRDEQGIQNTQEISRMCNSCITLLVNQQLHIPIPANALKIGDVMQ
jgi:hypothetical protein